VRVSPPAVFLATLGGLGRVPVGPGTLGSVVGVFLGSLLVGQEFGPLLTGIILLVTFVISAVICTRAEQQLQQHDPSAVILDEVWGMTAVLLVLPAVLSTPLHLFVSFGLFRAFDIIKPPPLKQLARLPAGWGIMADDLGATIYTIFVLRLLS